MRLSKLLCLVLMSVVLRALSTQQYPVMRKHAEASPHVNGDYYDYVYGDVDELGNDMEKSLDAAADGVLVVPGVAAVSVNPDCEPIPSATTLVSSVETTCLPVSNSKPPPIMGPTEQTTCEPPPFSIPTSPTIPPPASTTLPASSTTVLSCDRIFMNAAEQLQQMDNLQQQERIGATSTLAFSDGEQRSQELRTLVQHLYVAQARVQLEATEIRKAQAVASTAQSQLEESANHVRSITATLHNAQQEVAAAAIRAQIAQLQLAAHDQLLFAARQDVDALSSQMVGLQAAEGIIQPRLTVDLHALLDKLRQPLQQFDRPTAVPLIITQPPAYAAQQEQPSQGIDITDGIDANGQSNGSSDSGPGGAIAQLPPVRNPQNFNDIGYQSENAREVEAGSGVGGGTEYGSGGGGQYVNKNYT